MFISIPINSFKSFTFNIDKETLNILRFYIESVRFNDFHISNEEESFLKSQMELLLKDDSRIDESKLHLLMTLFRLYSISIGDVIFNIDNWNKVVSLFQEII